jgi:hypothetical protein
MPAMKGTPTRAIAAILVLAIAICSVVAHWRVLTSDYIHPDEQVAEQVVGKVLANRTLDTNWARTGVDAGYRNDMFNFSSYYLSAAGLEVLAGHAAADATDHPALRRHLRRMNCLFAGIAVVLAGLIAWRLANAADAAVVAALLTASNVTLFQDSIYARPDAFFTAATLLFVLITMSLRLRVAVVLLLTSTIGGFLLATKISFAPLLFFPPLIAAVRMRSDPAGRSFGPARAGGAMFLYACGIALGFALGAPYALVAPSEFLRGVDLLLRQYAGGIWPYGIPDAGLLERFGFGASYLAYTLGPVVPAFAIVGYAVLIRRRNMICVLALAGPMLTLLYFLQTHTFFERNFSHVLPLLFALAAFAAAVLVRRIRPWLLARTPRLCTEPYLSATLAGTAAILLAYPALAVSAKLYHLLRDNNYRRLIADEQERVSAGGTLPVMAAPNGVFLIPQLRRELCGKFVYSASDNGDRYTRAKLQALLDSGYRIQGTVYSPFHGSPTSTLWSYHATDVLFLLPPGDGDGECRAELIALHDDPALIAARAEVAYTGPWADQGFPGGMQTGGWRFPLYATWVGSDAATGRLTIGPFSACGPVVVPFAAGPEPANTFLRIERIEADRRETVFADHPPRVWAWSAIRIRAAADSCSSYVISAEDNGTGWGQWIGVGAPAVIAPARTGAEDSRSAGGVTAAASSNPRD